MRYFIGIDDTDNHESIGTGELAENLGAFLKENGCGNPSRVTRHQLFFNDAIAYTSHNSAMCFELVDSDKDIPYISRLSGDYLKKYSAHGSDPGLCIIDPDSIESKDTLMEFGRKAKSQVISKEEAFSIAQHMNIYLSEHGGSGIGVIGALAGVGLRLSGNDGRYKGQYHIGINQDNMLVSDILMHPDIDSVQDENGYTLKEHEEVFVTEKVKTVRLHGQSVLLVQKIKVEQEEIWKNLDKKQLKNY